MITSLFFLIVVLLLASVDTLSSSNVELKALSAVAMYMITLGAIVCQNVIGVRRHASRSRLLLIANLELVSVLAVLQFHLQLGAMLRETPVIGGLATFTALGFLVLYFFGLCIFYLTTAPRLTHPMAYMIQQTRLILPFALPYLFFCFFGDIANALGPIGLFQFDGLVGQLLVLVGFSIVFIAFVLWALPPLIVTIWRCQPLPDGSLKQRLLTLCQRAKFKHGGMLVWTQMHGYLTAAIVGVFPRFRYVMFTQGLLDKLPPDEVEAILAHEIGHSRHRHLLLYPLIVFGAVAVLALFEKWAVPMIVEWLGPRGELTSLALFIPEAILILLYLRLVFGFFSRLFERQADLHVFELGVNPDAMVRALDLLAIQSGYIHDQPSWHHWSIRQRMDFLSAAIENRSLVQQHHQRVRRAILCYVVLVVLLFSLLLH